MGKIQWNVVPGSKDKTEERIQSLSASDLQVSGGDEVLEPRPGLSIFIRSGKIETSKVDFEYINSPIQFGFMLFGQARARFENGGFRGFTHEMPQGSNGISCLPRSAGVLEWDTTAPVGAVTVALSRSMFFNVLKENLDEIPKSLVRVAEGRSDKPFIWSGRDVPSKRIALLRMLKCPFRGDLRKLYYEGLALELVSSELHEYISETNRCAKKNIQLTPAEIERIAGARDVLLDDLENPPSLAELALRCGLSESKLKRGFRVVFGKPIFRYYRDYRLDKACEYMESGEFNVSEAAYRIGYLSLGHFSKAFSGRFGVTPKEYLREQRNKQAGLKIGQLSGPR